MSILGWCLVAFKIHKPACRNVGRQNISSSFSIIENDAMKDNINLPTNEQQALPLISPVRFPVFAIACAHCHCAYITLSGRRTIKIQYFDSAPCTGTGIPSQDRGPPLNASPHRASFAPADI